MKMFTMRSNTAILIQIDGTDYSVKRIDGMPIGDSDVRTFKRLQVIIDKLTSIEMFLNDDEYNEE